jgi:DNA-binding NarL/FixJ family response regulator
VGPIRLLVADDHRVYREGIRVLLHGVEEVEVVGEAADGDETIRRAEQLSPDVILMDLRMPGTNGVEATRRIVARDPRVGVLMLTMYDDDASVFSAMRAGARGYLLKDADQADLLRAVRAVRRGEAIFSPPVARRLAGYFAALHASGRGAEAFPDLTAREREVLRLIAEGRSNAAIAARLGLSVKTVQNHISSIFNKLQVADRAQAIVRAREAGLGTDR